MAWQYLPLADRLAVTHVCRDWRDAALRTPSVWACVDFRFDRHAKGCACDECAFEGDEPRLRTNALLLSKMLPRSDRVALTVHVRNTGECPSYQAVAQLVSLLRPHVDRIIAIHADVYKTHSLASFFEEFKVFPALRVLSATAQPDDRNSLLFYAPFMKKIDLSSLHTLSLVHGWCIWASGTVTLPNVRTLRCTYAFRRPTLALLEACPNVSFLDVCMLDARYKDEHAGPIETIRDRLARIPNVRLFNMSEKVDWWVLETFDLDTRPVYEFAYRHSPSYTGCGVLEHVSDAEYLHATAGGGTVSIEAGREGRLRRLTFPPRPAKKGHSPPLWDSEAFSGARLRSLVVEWPAWHIVTDYMPCLPQLESITLHLPSDCTFTSPPVIGDEDDAPDDGMFPALKTVYVRGPGEGIAIPSWWWDAFTASLDLEHEVAYEVVRATIVDDSGSEEESQSDEEIEGEGGA